MAKKRLTQEQREIVIAARNSGTSYREAAGMAGCSESTARKIIAAEAEKVKILTGASKRAEDSGKAKFIENAWNIINRSVRLLEKRLQLAEENMDEIMAAVKEEVYLEGGDSKEQNRLFHALKNAADGLLQPSLREIAGVISSMYDRADIAEKGRIKDEDGIVNINE